ncbi:aspartate kinase [Saccharicrinis sp. FJH54]|uniref:aspartate kinase n=1 Tax=Saccharicrinis sp. FJH54 TaxID=3344665 RepID=UPI0035D50322
MKVLKFGGTSVGSAERIKNVADLIDTGDRKIVVLSAMSGTTNTLVEICKHYFKKDIQGAKAVIDGLEAKYRDVVNELLSSDAYNEKGHALIKDKFNFLRAFADSDFSEKEEKIIHAQGELISTELMHYYLLETGRSSALLPALEYMRIDADKEPDAAYIKEKIALQLEKYSTEKLLITQGYICLNIEGEVDNLQRGGSDYSASLVGAAINAEEIEIWTDIDGMHNNDPRIVENTKPIKNLSFEEAAELAYFGAKILHPTSVVPARKANIPVRLLNTMNPEAYGTLISDYSEANKIKAVAAKDGITAIKIKSGRMLLAYGFLRKVFEIFEKYKTPIDMITTSEVGVSLTIDQDKNLAKIVEELQEFGSVFVNSDQVIICVAGDLSAEQSGYAAKITKALKDVPLRMISYGGSSYNMSLLVEAKYKKQALQALSRELFD